MEIFFNMYICKTYQKSNYKNVKSIPINILFIFQEFPKIYANSWASVNLPTKKQFKNI